MIEQRQAPQKTLTQRVVETIIPKVGASVLDELNLSGCRITQDQDSHIQQGNGSMFAYDIACNRGQYFKVYTPNYFDRYVIESIGFDKRLGNYIVLRHGEFRFIYGHVFTELNVGDRLGKNTILGSVDKSGISTGYHLHIELWKRNSNIRWEHLYGKEIESNPKSLDLRTQRNWITDKEINQQILDFIASFEGLHLKAYWDFKQWSIGYGTISYEGEVINKQEAEKRARRVIQGIRERYNLQSHSIEVQTAVVSFVYNLGSLTQGQVYLLNNKHYRALGNNFSQYNKITINGEKVLAGGLVKRRQSEFNLLTR